MDYINYGFKVIRGNERFQMFLKMPDGYSILATNVKGVFFSLEKNGVQIKVNEATFGELLHERNQPPILIDFYSKNISIEQPKTGKEPMTKCIREYEAYVAKCDKAGLFCKPFIEWADLNDDTSGVLSDIAALDGRLLSTLSNDERVILDLFVSRGRKYGVAISVIKLTSPEDLLNAGSKEKADELLSEADSRINITFSHNSKRLLSDVKSAGTLFINGNKVRSCAYFNEALDANDPAFKDNLIFSVMFPDPATGEEVTVSFGAIDCHLAEKQNNTWSVNRHLIEIGS